MRRRSGVVAAVVAAVILVGGGVAVWSATRPSGPEETARRYLAALEAGDAAAVAQLLDLPREREDRLVAAWSAASDHPADARIDEVSESARGVEIRATATIDGLRRPVSFAMERADDGWRVADATSTARVTTSLGDSVRIGDVTVPAGEVELLPAAYEVHAAPSGLVEGSASVTVATGEPVELHLGAHLAPEAEARAQEQLAAYARECTAGGGEVPAACGIRIPWAADLAAASAFAYRVEQMPTLSIASDGASFVAGGGVVVATVTGSDRNGQAAAFTYRDEAWTLRGEVRVEGDTLTLAVR